MDWPQFWSTVGAALASSTVLTYLLKTFVAQQLSKGLEDYKLANARDLEGHKAALTKELTTSLEDYRTALRRGEIEFTGLYGRRADAIVEVAHHLRLLYRATGIYVSYFQGPEAGGQDATQEWNTAHSRFLDSLDRFRVYFDSATQTQLDHARERIFGIASQFRRGRMREERGRSHENDEDFWSNCEESLRGEVGTTLNALDREFRRLIGVPERDGVAPSAGLPTFAEAHGTAEPAGPVPEGPQ